MWIDEQKFERQFWGNCVNTLNEELKQIVYAKYMGLELSYDANKSTPYSIDLDNRKILDVGSGPTSLLLKCRNYGKSVVIDPCNYPVWVTLRYTSANIKQHVLKAEDLDSLIGYEFDEIWMYNVIQHTEDPNKIAENIKKKTSYVRFFEWCTKPHPGHPIETNKDILDNLFGVDGFVGELNGLNECYGIFWSYFGRI